MVRRFLECSNNNSRLKFFKETVIYDWTGPELESVAKIMGIADTETDSKKIYDLIAGELLKRSSIAA